MKKNQNETVMREYYTEVDGKLTSEYGEVNSTDLEVVKGFDLPVHKKSSKTLKK